jgi:hypothetical protein
LTALENRPVIYCKTLEGLGKETVPAPRLRTLPLLVKGSFHKLRCIRQLFTAGRLLRRALRRPSCPAQITLETVSGKDTPSRLNGGYSYYQRGWNNSGYYYPVPCYCPVYYSPAPTFFFGFDAANPGRYY